MSPSDRGFLTASFHSFLFRQKACGFLCALLLSLCVTSPVNAISRHVNLTELAAGAGRIVHARVTEVRQGTHPGYDHIAVTWVTLEVLETLKGRSESRVTFMQFAGGAGESRNFHLPRYSVDEEVVLFLYPESQYGFTSPVGEGQGRFLVRHDALTGKRTLVNDRGNRKLYEPLRASTAQSRLKLNSAERTLVTRENGAADLDTFRSLVRKLAANNFPAMNQ
jgi:hypothetical protein